MSDEKPRQPRAFDLASLGEAEPALKKQAASKPVAKLRSARKPKVVAAETIIRALPDEAALVDRLPATTPEALAEDLTPPPPGPATKRFKWSRLFWGALGGLISLAIGIWVDDLIRDLFARQDWLGWLAVGLAVLLVFAALAITLRETRGLWRMAKIEHLREDAAKAYENDDMKTARSVIGDLQSLYAVRPDTAQGRAALEAHDNEIIDGRDLLALAERDLMKPLDTKARALVMGSAKRVSIVTAVSPRALIDVGFVLVENMQLIRRLADLYGGRPGTLGFVRLARNVITHLAVTGSIAVGDGLVQQLVGHGLAAKISSRLGEGVVNGLLTARIGIAAIDVCRPLPFTDQSRPSVSDFMGELLKTGEVEPQPADGNKR